jgi:hypothetical protein
VQALGLGHQLGERRLAVEHLHQRRVGLAHPQQVRHVVAREDVAQAVLALGQPLELPAGAHPGAEAGLGAGLGDPRVARRRQDDAGVGGHHDGAAGLRGVAVPLDPQLDVAEADHGAVAKGGGARERAPVEHGSVARSGVLQAGRPAGQGHAGVRARDRAVVEADRARRRPADREVVREGHPHAAGQHQLEGAVAAGDGGAAGVAEGLAATHLAPARATQHRELP